VLLLVLVAGGGRSQGLNLLRGSSSARAKERDLMRVLTYHARCADEMIQQEGPAPLVEEAVRCRRAHKKLAWHTCDDSLPHLCEA
jgi:hypothetical protein